MEQFNKDGLKEEIANYRELFKLIFLIFIANITGTTTIIYKILTNELHFKYIFIALISIMFLSIFLFTLMKIWNKLKIITEELKNVTE